MTTFERLREEGRQKGREEGLRRAILLLLADRFGPPSPGVKDRVEAVPAEQLNALLVALGKAESLQALGLEP